MPNESEKEMKFKNFKHMQRIPFVIYVDFECYLEKIIADSPDHLAGSGKTVRDRKHNPIAVGLKVVSTRPGFVMPYEVLVKETEQDDLSVRFLLRLLEVEKILLDQLFFAKRSSNGRR